MSATRGAVVAVRVVLAVALGLAWGVASASVGRAAVWSPTRAVTSSARGATIAVPRDAPTIQAAVDEASPGSLVLVAPGVYRTAVVVTRPDIVVRGVDRNRTILDGEFRRATGIEVRADGVAIENLTARDYLQNGFYWDGVDGYRGSYLTAYRIGAYGLYAAGSQHGQFDHSLASGGGDSGFYVGACDPCHALVTDDVAEYNAVGLSATNASGDVVVAQSRWEHNGVGIVPNSLDDEPRAPQDGMVIAANLVDESRSGSAPRSAEFGALRGTGIALVGVLDDLVTTNRVAGAGAGIVVTPNPGVESEFRPSRRNQVRSNVVQRAATTDLVLVETSPADGNCFAGNQFRTSAPLDLEQVAPCEGTGSGDLSAGGVSATRLFARARHPGGVLPRQTPVPAPQPGRPGAVTAAARPATAEPSIAVDVTQLAVPPRPR